MEVKMIKFMVPVTIVYKLGDGEKFNKLAYVRHADTEELLTTGVGATWGEAKAAAIKQVKRLYTGKIPSKEYTTVQVDE